MPLYEELAKSFPVENVPPYGEVLIIPAKSFKPEWEPQLKAEGVQVYSNAYGGAVSFFLSKREVSMQNEADKSRKRVWTNDEIQLLLKLKNEGLSVDEIAKRLNRTPSSIKFKLFRLNPKNKIKQIQQETPQNSSKDDVLGEVIEALTLLHSKGLRNVCIFLLKNAHLLLAGDDAENG